MKNLILALLFSLCGGAAFLALPSQAWAAAPAASAPGIKSYREWKNARVLEANGRLEIAKKALEARKADPNLAKKGVVSATEAQVRAEQAAVEMARELSVSDYFAGYLTKMTDKNAAFKEVAGKLSADEVAELMSAYANSVFGTHTGLRSNTQSLSADTVK